MEYFKKAWPAIFAQDRTPREGMPHIQERLEILSSERNSEPTTSTDQDPISPDQCTNQDEEPKHLEHFLRGCHDGRPSSEEQEILKFCKGVHQSCLTKNQGYQPKKAWLDDRTYSFYENSPLYLPTPQKLEDPSTSGEVPPNYPASGHQDPTLDDSDPPFREYETSLSPQELFGHLKQKQFGDLEMPDADRRLISIVDLSPQFIFALTETALPHQAPSLIDGIYNHLTRKTCMSVHIPPTGYKVFRLRFHVPYYALRGALPNELPKEHMKDGVFTKPSRRYEDVSFLTKTRPTPSAGACLGLHQSHISITICGVANRRWTAYAFSDADYDGGKELPEDDFASEGAISDHIAGDNDVDANCPIFSPREYFLMVVSRRLKKVVDEWKYLVHEFENGKLAEHPPSIKNPSPEHEDGTTFDLTQEARLLLWELHDELGKTIEIWKQFSRPGGDIQYFHDSRDTLAIHGDGEKLAPWVLEIRGQFDELENLKVDAGEQQVDKTKRFYYGIDDYLGIACRFSVCILLNPRTIRRFPPNRSIVRLGIRCGLLRPSIPRDRQQGPNKTRRHLEKVQKHRDWFE